MHLRNTRLVSRARRRRAAFIAAVLLATIGAVPSSAAPLFVGRGLSSVAPSRAATTAGLHVYSINGHRFGVKAAIHVVSFEGSRFSMNIALAHGAIDASRQTPRAMCRITPHCVAAVNGDFFAMTRPGVPDPGDEVGGIIQDCILLHTPEVSHQQANLDTQTVTNGLNWSSTVNVNGTIVPITDVNVEEPLSYSIVSRPLSGTLLYTPAYALPTPVAGGWVTYQFTQVDPTVSPTTINTTTQLQFVAATSSAVHVAAGQVDITAPTSSVLATLQPGNTVTLTTTSTAGCNSIGGHPILLNQGAVVPIDPADTYMAKLYARTVVGWTASGATVIMIVEGNDRTSGATAHQLVALLRSIGVVTALDLDGGKSTSLYAPGYVLDHPANTNERSVSTSLLVVQN